MILFDQLQRGLFAVGIELPEQIAERQIEFLEELLRWNQKINLTAIRNKEEALEKHIIDSLTLLRVLPQGKSLLDMGSGAGLPCIPLALVEPDRDIISVDSVDKKINFQKHIKRLFDLERFSAVKSRVEELKAFMEMKRVDVVTARAFTSLEHIVRLADPFLDSGGLLLAMKGPESHAEILEAEDIIDCLNYMSPQIVHYKLPFSQADRTILVLKKKPVEIKAEFDKGM